MGFVLGATAFGVLVTSACTNVAGLTGYEFGDASEDGGGSGSDASVSDARVSDAPVAADGGGCKGVIDAGVATANPDCVACAESNCCDALAGCSDTICLLAARTSRCMGERACQKLAACFTEKCMQCKS